MVLGAGFCSSELLGIGENLSIQHEGCVGHEQSFDDTMEAAVGTGLNETC